MVRPALHVGEPVPVRPGDRVYRGAHEDRGVVAVFVEDGDHRRPLHNRHVYATGAFAWGDPGRAPADLAVALLVDAFDEDRDPDCSLVQTRAWRLHHRFKDSVVLGWPYDRAWAIRRSEILAWASPFLPRVEAAIDEERTWDAALSAGDAEWASPDLLG